MGSGASKGLIQARDKMVAAGVDEVAIETFAHYYRLLEHGETGMIPESTIDPVDMESLADVEVADDVASEAIRHTVVIKLNGGLGTSMGMDRAKSLLCVRRGLSFLDIIARQVLHLRKEYDAPLPMIFMNSFRTSTDTLDALGRYDELPVEGLPLEFLQNKEPKLLLQGPRPPRPIPRTPASSGVRRVTATSTPRCAAPACWTGCSSSATATCSSATPTTSARCREARVAGWFASSGAPFAIECVRRTASDRKGGHLARRKTDGRLVLRETAQTPPEDIESLADLDRHRFTSTNNVWFDLAAMKQALDVRQGILGLPLIRNVKHLDPADSSTPEVVQIETAMGVRDRGVRGLAADRGRVATGSCR